LEGHIELRNVSFSYPGREKPILDNVSIKFISNKKNALVAESG
jgi:ABC-type multidrug transport system fused ATPase/permease subunit